MNVLRQFALLALTVVMGLALAGCQPSSKTAATQPTLNSVALTPAAPSLSISSTLPLVATGTFSDNTTLDVTSAATFTSDNLAVATVSSYGIVRAINSASTSAAGVANITATVNGKVGTATITVPPPALVSVAVSPKIVSLFVGGAQPLSVRALYDQGSSAALTSGLTYLSDHTGVATVDGNGVVTAVATGTATITVTDTASGRTDTAVVSVTVQPVATLVAVSATPTASGWWIPTARGSPPTKCWPSRSIIWPGIAAGKARWCARWSRAIKWTRWRRNSGCRCMKCPWDSNTSARSWNANRSSSAARNRAA